MIITCDACSTNYTVPDGSIPEEGRNVKCAKCSNLWLAKPPAPAAPQKAEDKKRFKFNFKFNLNAKNIIISASLCCLLMFGYLFLNPSVGLRFLPFMSVIYDAAGLNNTEDMVLADVALESKVDDNGNNNLIIKGKIINNSDQKRNLPLLRLTLSDENGNKIAAQSMDYRDKIIGPNEEYKISNKITRLPSSVKFVILDIGNWLDFMKRS